MSYPAGAGPYAGAFTGDVYVPPGAGITAGDAGETITRPQIANAAGSPGAGGAVVATFTAPPTVAWLVRRIVVQSSAQGTALVYVGPLGHFDPTYVVSGTNSGAFDENDTNQPIFVPEGQTLSVVWAAGGTCQARIEYDEA